MTEKKELFSVLVVKPDIVKKGNTFRVLGKIVEAGRGLTIMPKYLWKVEISPETAKLFYPFNEEWGRKIGGNLKAAYNQLSLSCAEEFGIEDELELGRIVHGWVVDYMTSGLISAYMIKNENGDENVITDLKKLIGETDPSTKEGTIRAELCPGESLLLANKEKRAIKNGIHCSASIEDACREAGVLGLL